MQKDTVERGAVNEPRALLYDLGFRVAAADAECGQAVEIVERMRLESPDLTDWVNFPLMNKTGKTDDFALQHTGESGRYTDYASGFPTCSTIVEEFRARSLVVTNVRIAVLRERGIFRPHLDSYDSSRFLIPLNQNEADFRHIVDPHCFLMRAGELWWIDGKSLHGAANVGERKKRVMVLVDVTSASRREALGPSRPIPPDHLCPRDRWTSEARASLCARLRALIDEREHHEIEREMLMIPFLYELEVPAAYREIAAFCDVFADVAAREDVRAHYARLANRLRNPSLPFQVAASGFAAVD
jgi:hypothetical protein